MMRDPYTPISNVGETLATIGMQFQNFLNKQALIK